MHSDSYDNIAITQQLSKGGFTGDPYAPPEEKSYYETRNSPDVEIGYTAILSILSFTPIINETHFPLIIPWLVSILLFFTSYLLLKKIGKTDFISFFASLFVFFIPSSQEMLGLVFLVASNIGIALVPVLLFFGYDSLKNQKNQKKFIITSIITTLIYPPAVIIAGLALACFVFTSKELFTKNKQKILLSTGFFATLFVMYILFLVVSSGFNPLELLQQYGSEFIFAMVDFAIDQILLKQITLHNLPFFDAYLGLPLFLISLISIAYFAIKEIKHNSTFEDRLLFLPAITLIFLVGVNNFLEVGVLIPAERTILFASYFLLLTIGVFIGTILEKLVEKVEIVKTNKLFFAIIFCLILCAGIVLSSPLKKDSLEQNITQEELISIDWLKENTSKDTLILAPPAISKAIKVLSNRNVVCTTSTRFGCTSQLNFLSSSFFFVNCEKKQKIIQKYFHLDYVLIQKNIVFKEKLVNIPNQDCNFLELVFDEKNIRIYKRN